MKFIHFADAHLDSPFRGLSFLPSKAFNQIYQAADQSLQRIVDLAIQEKVDLVLIAGDTFDSTHPSPKSQLFFAEQIKRLTDLQIQVVMIFGNHDHMKISDLLVSDSPFFQILGPDEKVEKSEFSTKSGFKYDVVGFSYLNNHITDDKIPEFPNKGQNYTFGIMHAQEKTSTSSQNVYAPFELSEVRNLNYDYFALGHIHLRQTLSEDPAIVYSGNIQGRHINELGAKGCYLGKVDEETGKTEIEFRATSPIIWQAKDIQINGPIDKNTLRDLLQNVGPIEQTNYFSLRIHGAQYLNDEENELIQDSDFWQSLSINLPFDSQIVDVRLVSDEQLELNSNDQAAFNRAKDEVFSTDEFTKIIADWAKKDQISETAADDDQFKREVEELAQVKLAQKLKGIADETQTD